MPIRRCQTSTRDVDRLRHVIGRGQTTYPIARNGRPHFGLLVGNWAVILAVICVSVSKLLFSLPYDLMFVGVGAGLSHIVLSGWF